MMLQKKYIDCSSLKDSVCILVEKLVNYAV